MSLRRHAPAGVAAALAAAALGLTFQRERVHGAEIEALTKEIAGLRGDIAAGREAATPDRPVFARCAVDSDQIQAMAVGVAAALARSPATGPGARRAADAEPAGRTTEQEVALAAAGDLVEATIRRGGTLTRAEMGRIHAQIAAGGDSAESDALRARIAQAINQDKLAIERPQL